jgi:periplasmic protein TonB
MSEKGAGMFGSVVDPAFRANKRVWYMVPLTMLLQALIVAAFIITPLMATGVMPTPFSNDEMEYVTKILPPPPPPPEPPVVEKSETKSPDVGKDAAPLEPPKGIKKETGNETGPEEPREPPNNKGGVIVGSGNVDISTPPPPPPTPVVPVRIGGNIKPPQKTYDVRPLYPPIAQSARVEGIVIIEATIGPDGTVENAKVLRSIPLLDQSALDAVRQWIFTPTLLNGQPVPVVMTVTVQFNLRD